jgi:DNA topoisomerase-1
LLVAGEEPSEIGGSDKTAGSGGLRYVSDARAGIRRRRHGRSFAYAEPDGTLLSEPRVLARIRALAIPPAWVDVWICPYANGHIQATGRDARGRKQYRYHPRFREVREGAKYDHLIAFARALPGVRRRVGEHMALPGLPKEKVLATVVHLLDTTLIRVGNDNYARQNRSYGLTTLQNRHVAVEGSEIRFRFNGKGGKQWLLTVRNRRVAKVVKACQELPGQELLQYLDENGNPQDVSSEDVNAYLRKITGQDITAKDFRTWAGTALAAFALDRLGGFNSAAQAKRNVRAAMAEVAARLGNTSTICRKCYVHPQLLEAYLKGDFVLQINRRQNGAARQASTQLQPEEAAVLAFLESRAVKGELTRS